MTAKSRPDNLIAGDFLTLTESVAITAGEALPRGAVLGRITASGKYCLAAAAAADGSKEPVAVLAENVPAGDGDRAGEIYITGIFSAGHVTLGEGMTPEEAKDALHARSIFLVETV